MDNWNIKKIGVISVLAVLLIIGAGFGGYKYTKINQYNNLISDANKHMEDSEYDKAIDLFQQSLTYKDDSKIKDSISLAESLTTSKKAYDEGLILMNSKKYLEAIEQFQIIEKESDKFYSDAQNMIDKCNKEYIALNISEANISLESNKYDEANKYIAQVFKIDNTNEEAKKLKDIIDKKIIEQLATQNANEEQEKAVQLAKEEQEKIKEQQEKEAKAAASNITAKSAEDIVRKLMISASNTKTISQFDHEETVDGVAFFVIHVYDVVVDHTATLGWYYVNQKNGKVFDGTYDDFTPMN